MHLSFKYILILFTFNLVACGTNYAPVSDQYGGQYKNRSGDYVCNNISPFKGKVIGSGECVDLVKRCAGAPHTSQWKPGGKVVGQPLTPGTAIATFKRGKYPNKSGYHAAIYSHQTSEGIYVWDQWRGKSVHLRLIRTNQSHKKPGNNASKYRVITKR